MKKVLLSILIILLLAGLGLGVYYYLTKPEKEVKKEKVKEEVKTEEINPNDSLVENLMEVPHYTLNPFIDEDVFGYFYKKDSYKIKSVDNSIKLFLAINSLKDNSWDLKGVEDIIEVSEADVKTAIQDIFGKNFPYIDESISIGICAYGNFKYDDAKKSYSQPGLGCGGTLMPYYDTKIIKVSKTSDSLEVIEKAILVVPEPTDDSVVMRIYKPNGKEVIATEDGKPKIDNYLDKVDSYKYTFKIDDDNYYFVKVEKE